MGKSGASSEKCGKWEIELELELHLTSSLLAMGGIGTFSAVLIYISLDIISLHNIRAIGYLVYHILREPAVFVRKGPGEDSTDRYHHKDNGGLGNISKLI